MNNMAKAETTINDFGEKAVLKVKIKIAKNLIIRAKVAQVFVYIAAKILGTGFEIEINPSKSNKIKLPLDGIQFSEKVAHEFWRVWEENGETHKHGFYESTWMSIWAALRAEPNFDK